jgi:hypothetical protein
LSGLDPFGLRWGLSQREVNVRWPLDARQRVRGGLWMRSEVLGWAADKLLKTAAKNRAEARLARRVPYDLGSNEKLDPMEVLEEAMRHFYRKAKIEESLGRFCDFRIVDKAIETAARIGREIVSFRHPRISAIKLAVACEGRGRATA